MGDDQETRLEEILNGTAAPKGWEYRTGPTHIEYSEKEVYDGESKSRLIQTPKCHDCQREFAANLYRPEHGFCDECKWQCPSCEEWKLKPELDYICGDCRGF